MKKIKVAKIISEYEIIINAGSEDGIEQGDSLKIVDKKDRVVKDPDSGSVLGTFPGYKAIIQAKEVAEKYTICRSPITYQSSLISNVYNSLESLTSAASLSVLDANNIYGTKSSQEKLNVNEDDIDDIYSTYTNSIIKIGDEVVKIWVLTS